ncbi:MAG: FAD-dependent oxidoreductase [Turicibacter sp.]|nr:FAD-dependent oxidoreductase [Turicibacter sp.]
MKKKLFLFALVLFLGIGLVACNDDDNGDDYDEPDTADEVEDENGDGAFTPGTFTAQASGWGIRPIVIDVTFSEDAITDIEIISHDETPGLSDIAFDQVPAQIIEHQLLNVDAVAGATLTRMGIIMATRDAIEQAGGNVADFNDSLPAPVAGDPITREVDIVVVGGGGAGMTAAIAAIEAGSDDVLLVEMTAQVGGNTLAAGNGFLAWNAIMPDRLEDMEAMGGPEGQRNRLNMYLGLDPDTFSEGFDQRLINVQAEIEAFLDDDDTAQFDSLDFFMVQTYLHSRREELDGTVVSASYDFVRLMVEGSYPALQWIESLGGEFEHAIGEPVGAMWRRGARPANGNHADLFQPMLDELDRLGGDIMFNTRIENLIFEDGEVTGVVGTMTDGTEVTIYADSVVLATGGFAANLDMVSYYDNFWGDDIDLVTGTTNVSAARGDGIIMAQEVGADVYQMGITQLMQLGFAHNGVLATGHANYSFYVNQEGVRFINETAPRDTVAAAAFAQGGTFFEVRSNINEVWNQLYLADDGTSRIYTADTIAELAEMVGIDPDVLEATFEEFVAFAEAGYDEEFGRTTFFRRDDELPIATGPWHIRVLRPSTHYTNGGLLVDTYTRVINTDGEAIPNLFAAGEIMSGVHGGNRLGGNAVAEAFVFGRIAGEMAAENAGN